MMRSWGSGPGCHYEYERGYGNLTEEQRTELERLDRKFHDETANLRNEAWEKSAELDTLLNSRNLDPDKVKTVQGELNDLRAKLDEKQLSHELEVRKISPEARFGRGYGRAYYGHHMGGYGPGSCWNK